MIARIGFLRRLAGDQRGLALIEFAMVLPVLLLLYLAGYQIQDALSCNRKVTIATRAIADLTTQYSVLTPGQTDDILNASKQIMAPYNVANATLQVVEVYTDTKGQTTVQWCRTPGQDCASLTKGTAYTLPTTIKTNDTYMIVAKVIYAYKPAVTFSVVKPLTLGDVIYMSPRVSKSVDRTT